jgi:hypothetical protein
MRYISKISTKIYRARLKKYKYLYNFMRSSIHRQLYNGYGLRRNCIICEQAHVAFTFAETIYE